MLDQLSRVRILRDYGPIDAPRETLDRQFSVGEVWPASIDCGSPINPTGEHRRVRAPESVAQDPESGFGRASSSW